MKRHRLETARGHVAATARPALVVLLLHLACLAATACGGSAPDSHAGNTQPTLIVAVDGLDWQLLLPAMRAGDVPNLTDLARRGGAARLTTFEPTDSPVIWTSVATGKTKEKHGIASFAERVGDNLVPVTSNQRLTRAFWNILGEAGLKTAVVGWWVTWPAEPIDGWMVAPVSTVSGRTWKGTVYPAVEEQTWPPALMAELQPLIDEVETDASASLETLFPLSDDAPDWMLEFRRDLGWSWITDRIFVAAAEHIASSGPPKVMAVYQGLVDVGGHRFWEYTFPRGDAPPHGVSVAVRDQVAGYLPTALRELDAAIGRLRAAMPADADVIVLSDHGMHHRRRTGAGDPGRHPLVRYNTGAHGDAPDGVWIAAGPSFRAPKPPFSPPDAVDDLPRRGDEQRPGVLDLTPTLLYMHGLPVADDMDGRIAAEMLVEGPDARPADRIASYENASGPTERPQPIRSGADEATIERLRSLGYLD